MPELIISEINPTLLITEKISGDSGKSYSRKNVESTDQAGNTIQHWETTLVTDNTPAIKELRRLKVGAYAALRKVCSATPAGLLCPESKRDSLEEIIRAIRAEMWRFNSSQNVCSLSTRYSILSVPVDSKTVIASIAERISISAGVILDWLQNSAGEIICSAQPALLRGLTPEQVLSLEPRDRERVIARVMACSVRAELTGIRCLDGILTGDAATLFTTLLQQSREIAATLVRDTNKGTPLADIFAGVSLSFLQETKDSFAFAASKADEEAGYDPPKVVAPESPLEPVAEPVATAPSILESFLMDDLEEEVIVSPEDSDWTLALATQITSFGD